MFLDWEEDIFVTGNSSVLLMEDDEMTKEITMAMLRYLGYAVEAVNGGEEAVSLYRLRKEEGRPFKIVILDVCQPEGLSGEEILRRLLEYDPDARAVASSGFTCGGTMTGFRALGFRAPLPKPYGIRELGSVLRAVLGAGPAEGLENIRRDVRHGIVANFRFVLGNKPENICEGVTINISKHGFGFLTETAFTRGQTITVTGHDLPDMAGCRARVVWVREGPRHYRAGARFVSDNSAQRPRPGSSRSD
jgi:DNA-binding response OmpR family regulator